MRIFTEGAEMQDIIFWNGGTYLCSITTGYLSPYAYRFSEYAGVGYGVRYFNPLSECYLRFRYYKGQYGYTTNERLPSFRYQNTDLMRIKVESDYTYHLIAMVGGGTVYDSSVDIFAGIWYLFEVYFKLDDSAGRIIVKRDGITIIDYTGDTKPDSNATFDNIVFQIAEGYIDDLALNSTDNSDGKNDNSWCGDGVITKITPTGSGIINDWLNNGGVSGSANYLYVDEYPNDGDTTYVYASNLSGCQTNFAMSDSFDGSNKTITRIYSEGRARKTSAYDYGIKIGTIASGGTNVLSGSLPLTIGTYTRIVGPEEKVNPVTSASWVKSDIDGLELVAQIP